MIQIDVLSPNGLVFVAHSCETIFINAALNMQIVYEIPNTYMYGIHLHTWMEIHWLYTFYNISKLSCALAVCTKVLTELTALLEYFDSNGYSVREVKHNFVYKCIMGSTYLNTFL